MKMDFQKRNMAIVYIIIWLLSFTFYNIILSYSAAPAEKSRVESEGISTQIAKVIKNVLETQKSNERELERKVHHVVRKLAHMSNFFIFSFINAILFFVASEGSFWKTLFAILFIGFLGGALDEWFQLSVEGRAGRFSDVIIDFCGTCGAVLFFYLLMRHRFAYKDEKVIV